MKRTHVFGFILAALATVALGATTYTRLAGYSRQGPTQFIALPDANHAALAGIHVGDGTAGQATTPDDAYVEGKVEVDGLTLAGGGLAHTITTRAVSLTSPTVTFAVQATDDVILLSSDANQTAIVPTGGTLNQRITIRAGASGSNTMRLDDGTSTVIGANMTLTEAQYDYITLDCIDADGDEWAEVSSADN